MSKINDLIIRLCPNGVEYRKLGEICKINKGKQLNKALLLNDGVYPVINGGINPSGYWNEFNYTEKKIAISQGGASAGHVTYQLTKFWAGAHCYVVDNCDDNIVYKYLYHFLKSKEKELKESQIGAGIPSVSLDEIYKLKIPVPPLEIQKEVVRILDKFGELEVELEAKLEAELEMRQSQYKYWSAKLLDKDENLYKIGDLFEFKNGINKGKDYFGTGNPIINYVDVYKNNKITKNIVNGLVEANVEDLDRYSCRKGDVFFTRTSETREEVGYASVLLESMDDSVFSGFLLRARPLTDKLLPEYCAYCFSSPRVRADIISKANYTTRATVTGSILSKIEIYVPSKDEQKNIVEILDKLHALINLFVIGIPVEIQLRKKQYEYYRDKLLSFEQFESE